METWRPTTVSRQYNTPYYPNRQRVKDPSHCTRHHHPRVHTKISKCSSRKKHTPDYATLQYMNAASCRDTQHHPSHIDMRDCDKHTVNRVVLLAIVPRRTRRVEETLVRARLQPRRKTGRDSQRARCGWRIACLFTGAAAQRGHNTPRCNTELL